MGKLPIKETTWESPRLAYIGHVGEIVAGGGGKLSTNPGDPGEPERKPPGGGGE